MKRKLRFARLGGRLPRSPGTLGRGRGVSGRSGGCGRSASRYTLPSLGERTNQAQHLGERRVGLFEVRIEQTALHVVVERGQVPAEFRSAPVVERGGRARRESPRPSKLRPTGPGCPARPDVRALIPLPQTRPRRACVPVRPDPRKGFSESGTLRARGSSCYCLHHRISARKCGV